MNDNKYDYANLKYLYTDELDSMELASYLRMKRANLLYLAQEVPGTDVYSEELKRINWLLKQIEYRGA